MSDNRFDAVLVDGPRNGLVINDCPSDVEAIDIRRRVITQGRTVTCVDQYQRQADSNDFVWSSFRDEVGEQ